MEYIYQTEERSLFARLLPLIILVLLVLQNFGMHAKKYTETHYAQVQSIKEVVDLTPFQEKRIWLDFDKEGRVLICSQRIMLYPDLYRSADIFCARAMHIPTKDVEGAYPQALCWKAGDVVLCQTTEGDLQFFKPGASKPIEQTKQPHRCEL
ncbi:MAG: hypothetical protein UV38_C0001G0016 [candidate division TM6 bacterium GW2011_GWE2_42_60]|nr:MAG: hypothetical protein UV38_C0001G0016 [candidate division TM6 bacterium GW2011_GWE2_42_60]HBY05788.1 hypothetical protein [Candidatus Dependentiae bacterium]